jgi:hypothetical protein
MPPCARGLPGRFNLPLDTQDNCFFPLLLGLSPQDDENRRGEQGQGDVLIPTRLGADFVLIQAHRAFGLLQTRLAPPPLARSPHEARKQGLCWPTDAIVGALAGLGQAPLDEDPRASPAARLGSASSSSHATGAPPGPRRGYARGYIARSNWTPAKIEPSGVITEDEQARHAMLCTALQHVDASHSPRDERRCPLAPNCGGLLALKRSHAQALRRLEDSKPRRHENPGNE